ncbi:ABC transporter ATP-binding protein [Microlunatus sp. Gsoil 973]|uniref:ABC transporter ATP-binding protein n=1 Tax=Microlunatus sp. Gsoil 973 TaxID=2672569 RepID=UPI0012B4BCE3|nr:ABC transporter ATP-binding protein [Microlunatus sp. Gsoil 973]QGN33855.1 ATP-binding cassette domain-containing protein [Microlunatus sp. Gsoil 973]
MTTPVVEVSNLVKRYRDTSALDDVSLTLRQNTLYGLLGRNGAGKTTLMSILTAQNFETSGTVRVFGKHPYENASVLSRMCFIRESQRYPDGFRARHAFRAASMFFHNWDQQLCDQLIRDFELPQDRTIKKLSRGQTSAVGVIIGLASRAEITFFDEPYLGLDAVARQIFYDRLLAEYSEFPRTIVLSSHLIDEVSNLLEHVIVLDHGRVVMDADADEVRGSAFTLIGPKALVESFVGGREVIHREAIGSFASVTVEGPLSALERREATELGLDVAPVSLQQLVIRRTTPEVGSQAGEDRADRMEVVR